MHIDTLLYANEVNRYGGLDKQFQYDYFFNAIRKMKRKFQKWPKKSKSEDLEKIMECYNVSRRTAEEYALVLTESQIKELYAATEKGGTKKTVKV
jgi:hypothetical protein